MGLRTRHDPGTFSWVDLATTDADRARAFYGGLFGWETVDTPGSAGTESMCNPDIVPVAALDEETPGDSPPRWTSYATVEAVEATAGRVDELGGKLLAGPFEVGDAGRMAIVQDSHGAV